MLGILIRLFACLSLIFVVMVTIICQLRVVLASAGSLLISSAPEE